MNNMKIFSKRRTSSEFYNWLVYSLFSWSFFLHLRGGRTLVKKFLLLLLVFLFLMFAFFSFLCYFIFDFINFYFINVELVFFSNKVVCTQKMNTSHFSVKQCRLQIQFNVILSTSTI